MNPACCGACCCLSVTKRCTNTWIQVRRSNSTWNALSSGYESEESAVQVFFWHVMNVTWHVTNKVILSLQESDPESSCGSPDPAISMGVDESTDIHLFQKHQHCNRAEEPHQNDHHQQQQQQHKMTPAVSVATAAHLNGTSKFVQLSFVLYTVLHTYSLFARAAFTLGIIHSTTAYLHNM